MPVELADRIASAVGPAWPLFATLVGSLVRLISGSATFSNMMFSCSSLPWRSRCNIPEQLVLALQALGANAGNMICVLNVVAAASVVGLHGAEGKDHSS
jgi:lactate permease